MKDNEIKVSVCCITYGQEDYIRQTLDSIIMQKTNFKFELIVANDNSPDNTKEILKEYEDVSDRNPNCVTRIYNHTKNKGAIENEHFVMSQGVGEYKTLIEGDDYWIDENKLQKQVDFLDTHPEFAGVAHEQEIVDINGKYLKKYSDNSKYAKSIYRFADVKSGKMPFQESSLLARNYWKTEDYSCIYDMQSIATDKLMFAWVADFGDIYIMSDAMSAYRIVVNRYNKTVFESISNGLEYLNKFEKINFKNHGHIDFSWYKRKIIGDYYLLSFLRKEKRTKEHDKIIKSYSRCPIFIIIINRIFIQIVDVIRVKIFNLFRKKK